ncbi:MAG TPA: ABC transporter substrate-binding protein, partial [Xanthobacteraceae bacterium]|nr:ABC transporter substrate-binding protein [Xanthobacteraceae bacterium]
MGLGFALAVSLAYVAHAQAQTEKVMVGISNAATDAGFYIADKKGYFRDAGIAVDMTAFPSAAKMIAPLGSGELDVGAGTVSAGLYNAVERGIALRIVADKGSVTDKLEYSTLIVRKDLV